MRRTSWVHAVVLVVLATVFAERTTVAAEFRVGPGGTHATIQAAIDAALAAPGDDVIKVQTGMYHENLLLVGLSDRLEISGAWNPLFDTRRPWWETRTTIVDGARLGRTMLATVRGGSLRLDRLDLTNGEAHGPEGPGGGSEAGGGMQAVVADGGSLELVSCYFENNSVLARPVDSTYGGGAYVRLSGGARLEVHGSGFARNRLVGGGASGGGLAIETELPRNRIWVTGSRFAENFTRSTATPDEGAREAYGSGLFILVGGEGDDVVVQSSRVEANTVETVVPSPEVSAFFLATRGRASHADVHQDHLGHNRGGPQAVIVAWPSSRIRFSDSLVIRGTAGVELATVGDDSSLYATNLTIAHNGTGARTRSSVAGSVTIANTVLFLSGAGIEVTGAAPVSVNNLVGIDPLFVDADTAALDYHVLPGSPAVDAGNDAPPGGLGPTDFDGRPRVQGAHVDIGAYETEPGGPGVPGDACVVRGFGVVPFVPALSGACRCFRDAGLRELRCGFFLPELFLDAALPSPLLPGQPAEAKWVVHPWQGPEGPYEMKLEILSQGKWMPLVGRGKPTGKLALDKLVGESFAVVAPAADAPVRASIRHLAAGPNGPGMVEDVVYMLVDVATIGEQP